MLTMAMNLLDADKNLICVATTSSLATEGGCKCGCYFELDLNCIEAHSEYAHYGDELAGCRQRSDLRFRQRFWWL
ncbi:hypothetical protein L195_g002663 [Trifolium pratense]|uniref:Uncharacterized protein n=1 Tax=Trifolium pratense TaxID=57577 RepID=A0A2K3NT35_TRIPR|nr:hypothetical protein L195_g002663 [Trifolium pratense]